MSIILARCASCAARSTRPDDAGRGCGTERRALGLLLRELLAAIPEHATLARDLRCVRAQGRPHHARHHPPAAGGEAGRAPFDAGDGYALATALDDVVDYTEQAAAQLDLYGVEAPMEQAVDFAECSSTPAQRSAGAALPARRRGARAAPGRDPPPRERGRPPPARRGRLAVRRGNRPDGGDPLEGHLRVARGGGGRLRDGRARARGHHAQARPAALSAGSAEGRAPMGAWRVHAPVARREMYARTVAANNLRGNVDRGRRSHRLGAQLLPGDRARGPAGGDRAVPDLESRAHGAVPDAVRME